MKRIFYWYKDEVFVDYQAISDIANEMGIPTQGVAQQVVPYRG